MKSLEEVLGLKVICDPDWPLLLAGLGDAYADAGQLIREASSCVWTWCKGLLELIENAKTDDWTDKLVDLLKESHSRVILTVEVSR